MLDTGTMMFAPTSPNMQARREGCAAVLLQGERRVLVISGRDGSAYLATTEIIDTTRACDISGTRIVCRRPPDWLDTGGRWRRGR